MQYRLLVLCGFRGTGKSTIAGIISERIGWSHIEMDKMIEKRTGNSIQELTDNGTHWQQFRAIEYTLLEELLDRTHVVISAGGGVGVNDVPVPDASETYGSREATLLQRNDIFVAVLTASEETIIRRIRHDERHHARTIRPVLHEKTAQELRLMSFKQKNDRINALVNTNIQVYRARTHAYQHLSPFQFDTSSGNPFETATTILRTMNRI